MKRQDFIKTDDNIVVNKNCIRWVQKVNECMEICTMFNGCTAGVTTMRLCKNIYPKDYETLNKLFEPIL